jgi:hypothetical protein
MTDDQNDVEQPEQTVKPPRPRSASTAPHPRSSDKDAADTVADERSSPFPYAERFDEWVADETAPDERRRSQAGG